MKTYNISVVRGDGIGTEVVQEAIKVLDLVSSKFDFKLEFKEYLLGGCAIDLCGEPLPKETLDGILDSDALLFGAIGGEKWDKLPRHLRPESGLLALRKALGAFANLRPVKVYDDLLEASPLKPSVVKGTDLVVVRELIGGIYFGTPREKTQTKAFNTMVYSVEEIQKIAKIAFETAQKRSKKVCSVDKANVLEVSMLWREVVEDVAKNYPDVSLSHMYVDNASMQLVRDPKQFDVILTSNLFGDILSDLASQISGSIGLLASSSLGNKVGMYEPIHGSAPDIMGQNIANPIAAILSASFMLRYSFGEIKAANTIEKAIEKALKDGYKTKDLSAFGAKKICSTQEMGDVIAKNI